MIIKVSNTEERDVKGLKEMYTAYEQSLTALYGRRDQVIGEVGMAGKRLAVLEAEIEEMEEAMMLLRKHI